MAAETWVNDSGTARRIQEIWVNDSGTARRIQEIWVNDNGTARRIYAGDIISIANQIASSLTVSPANAAAQYQLRNDGNIAQTNGTNVVVVVSTWITPAINMSLYECRATMISGTLTSGATGAWQSLSSTRGWSLARTTVGLVTASFTLEIRRASDAVVMDTASITLEAEKES